MKAAATDSLPHYARSVLNRCNLPAVILGGLTFQTHPQRLFIDGVETMHRQFFESVASVEKSATRALFFHDYMCSCFLLDCKDEAGFSQNSRIKRNKADYLRLLRGWMFNPDGIEAAVLKRWVESRFGLLCQNHKASLRDFHSAAYAQYQADYMRGLYNTNALEAQLDLLYGYCQYELQRRYAEREHWSLFRGVNRLQQFDVVSDNAADPVLLLNNLNSFSNNDDTAGIFGDVILNVAVPASKLLYFPGLLPGVLKGEEEFLVIGGVYRVKRQF